MSDQTELADLWCEVLGVAEAAPDQHFFSLGGDSLMAMDLVELAGSRLDWELPIEVLFGDGTLGGLQKAYLESAHGCG